MDEANARRTKRYSMTSQHMVLLLLHSNTYTSSRKRRVKNSQFDKKELH